MTLEIDSDSESLHGIRQRERHQRARGLVAGVTGALPPMVAFTERAAAILRAYLRRQGLRNYEIFYSWDLDLHDIDDHLSALAEQGAAWQPLPAMVTPGLPVTQLRPDENRRIKARTSGVLRLTHHQVVLAHWFWVEPVANKPDVSLWLCAAPSPDHYARLRQDVHRLRSQGKTPVWQIVSGDAYLDQRILHPPSQAQHQPTDADAP